MEQSDEWVSGRHYLDVALLTTRCADQTGPLAGTPDLRIKNYDDAEEATRIIGLDLVTRHLHKGFDGRDDDVDLGLALVGGGVEGILNGDVVDAGYLSAS